MTRRNGLYDNNWINKSGNVDGTRRIFLDIRIDWDGGDIGERLARHRGEQMTRRNPSPR